MICLSLAASTLAAQTTTTTTQAKTTPTTTSSSRATQPVTAATDRDLADPNAMKLSVSEALRVAVRQNLGIELQSYDYRMAGESLRSQYGLYDWFGRGDFSRGQVKGPDATGGTATTETDRADIGVAQNLPAGGDYYVFFNNLRQGASWSPSIGLQATQPLLRNFGVDVAGRNVLIARNTLGINREAFRLALMDTAVAVQQAYYDLVYARRSVEVAKESVFLARDQSRITQIRIDVGASAPLDILQPRVQIATTEETLIGSVASVRNAEDRLRQLLNLPMSDWGRPIVPTDPVDYTPVAINIDDAVGRALTLRPEMLQTKLTTETRKVQYVYASNQVLPQLDLNLNYQVNTGRTVSGFDPNGSPIFTTPTYSQGIGQLGNFDFPGWTVSATVGVPLSNIGARAERKRAELDLSSSRVSQDQMSQTISVGVRQAARNVETAASLITATRAAREAAEQNLEAERRRYENGMTTNFQVLQIQQQLSDSRVRELQALVGYNQAVAQYHRQVGDILDVNNITIDEPPISPEPRVFSVLDRYNWLNYGHRVNTNPPVEAKKP